MSKNNQKRVSLNETTLRHMIREGIKKALNELDWRTYASARDKQPRGIKDDEPYALYNAEERLVSKLMRQDGLSSEEAEAKVKTMKQRMNTRYNRFADAAQDAFSKQHDFSDDSGRLSTYGTRSDSGKLDFDLSTRDKNGNENGRAKYFVTDGEFCGQNGSHTPGKWCVGTTSWAGAVPVSQDFDSKEEAEEYARANNMSIDAMKPSDELNRRYSAARKEIDDYRSGKSKYSKEKGWSNESVNNKINQIVAEAFDRIMNERKH